jgi:predicted Zn-dependent protease
MGPTSEQPLRATLFGDGLPDAGAEVRLHLRSRVLEIEPTDGRDEEVAYASLQARAGGWRGDSLMLEWRGERGPRTLVVQDAQGLAALRAAAPPELRRQLGAFQASERRGRWLHRSSILAPLVAAAAVAVLAVGLVVRSERLVAAAVDRIPAAWEERLGEAAAVQTLAGARRLDEGEAHRVVQDLGDRLAARTEAAYRFRWILVDDPTINALALPGGTVVVFTGLVRFADTPEELAGVLAHEVEHVVLRHSLRALVRSLGWRAVLSLLVGGAGELGDQVAVLVERLGGLRYSRQQESEADLEGVRLLQRAGIDARGMQRFFDRLAEQSGEVPGFLSTHPASRERAERIREQVEAQPPPAPLPYDWPAVRADLERRAGAAPR